MKILTAPNQTADPGQLVEVPATLKRTHHISWATPYCRQYYFGIILNQEFRHKYYRDADKDSTLSADHTIMDVYRTDGSYKGSFRIPAIAQTKAKAIHIVKDFAIVIYQHSFAIYCFDPDLFKDGENRKKRLLN